MNKIGILSIIKNEHQYLDEWIQYHLSLGIDKIYLFEDIDSDSHKCICNKYSNVICNSILSSYKDEKIKDSVISNKRNHLAPAGYRTSFMRNCLDYIKANDDLDWVTYIDVNEFLTLENKGDSIHSIMNEFSDYSIVVLQWMNYNASGFIHKPDLPVLDAYYEKCKLYVCASVSQIISSKLMFNMHTGNFIKCNHHIPMSNSGWCKTDFSTDTRNVVYDKLYIRHYITKSFEEYCHKIFLRGQFFESKGLNHFFEFNPSMDRNNKEIVAITNKYYDMFMNGEINYYI